LRQDARTKQDFSEFARRQEEKRERNRDKDERTKQQKARLQPQYFALHHYIVKPLKERVALLGQPLRERR